MRPTFYTVLEDGETFSGLGSVQAFEGIEGAEESLENGVLPSTASHFYDLNSVADLRALADLLEATVEN